MSWAQEALQAQKAVLEERRQDSMQKIEQHEGSISNLRVVVRGIDQQLADVNGDLAILDSAHG